MAANSSSSPSLLGGTLFQGSASPPAWTAAMVGEHEAATPLSWGAPTSGSRPYELLHACFCIISEPFSHDSPDTPSTKVPTLFSVCERVKLFIFPPNHWHHFLCRAVCCDFKQALIVRWVDNSPASSPESVNHYGAWAPQGI